MKEFQESDITYGEFLFVKHKIKQILYKRIGNDVVSYFFVNDEWGYRVNLTLLLFLEQKKYPSITFYIPYYVYYDSVDVNEIIELNIDSALTKLFLEIQNTLALNISTKG